MSKYGVFFGPYFPVFGLNREIYSVNLRIQSEYRKIRIRKNSVFGHFSRSVTTTENLWFSDDFWGNRSTPQKYGFWPFFNIMNERVSRKLILPSNKFSVSSDIFSTLTSSTLKNRACIFWKILY